MGQNHLPARWAPACLLLVGSAAATVEGVEATTHRRFGFSSRLASAHKSGEKFAGLPLLRCSFLRGRNLNLPSRVRVCAGTYARERNTAACPGFQTERLLPNV